MEKKFHFLPKVLQNVESEDKGREGRVSDSPCRTQDVVYVVSKSAILGVAALYTH